MLDPAYIDKVRQALLKHYHTNNSYRKKQNSHHVHIMTEKDINNAVITYWPDAYATRGDNTGKLLPIHLIYILAVADGDKWTELVNQQVIHAQRFTGDHFTLNLNFRRDNDLSDSGAKKLKDYLSSHFAIDLTKTGSLVAKTKGNFLQAFLNLLNAIRYVQQYGVEYIRSRHTPDSELDRKITAIQDKIKHDSDDVTAARRKNTPKRHEHATKSKGPKAPGMTVKKKSSITGTPRMIRLHHEAVERKKREMYLKTHPEAAKKQKLAEQKKAAHIDLAGAKVAIIGRTKQPHKAYAKLVAQQGGKLQQAVNGSTDYVICDKPSKAHAYQVAKKRQLPMMSESQFKQRIK